MNKFKEKYYNFAVSDFDGTIFRSDKTISKRTVNAINEFSNNGGIFCICTGRMTTSIMQYCLSFGFSGYVISYNGAEITEISKNKTVFKNHVDNDACIKLLRYGEQNGHVVQVYPNDRLTVNLAGDESKSYAKLTNVPVYEHRDKVSKLFEETGYTSAKVLFYTNDQKADTMLFEIKQILGEGYNVIRSNGYHIDVTKKGVSKGDTIKKLAKILNADMQKLICFGDEMNDKSMLEVAALSCLCSSGNEKLKSQVDVVIDTCDNDGVAKALEKYGI